MSNPIVYVLDANVFIEAARRYYAFDIAPTFWQALIDHAQNGSIRSIDRVKDELSKGHDELVRWANNDFHPWFKSSGETDVIHVYSQIMQWVQAQTQFTNTAKSNFANDPDGWLIAYAKVKGYTLVTHERFDPNIRRKVPIPNVCKAFGVTYTDTFQMLRALGVRF